MTIDPVRGGTEISDEPAEQLVRRVVGLRGVERGHIHRRRDPPAGQGRRPPVSRRRFAVTCGGQAQRPFPRQVPPERSEFGMAAPPMTKTTPPQPLLARSRIAVSSWTSSCLLTRTGQGNCGIGE